MSNIKFVSHETFPDDPYTKELVYLCLDEKYRVAYVRKLTKTGGQFWSVITAGITKDQTKHYYESFLQDSTFMDKDIKEFLDKRKWESPANKAPPKPVGIDEENIPF
jgi:hypothetical protein